MAFKKDFLSTTVTVAATTATVITFDKGVPQGPFRRFNTKITGANNSLAGSAIDAYRVKLDSTTIWDMTPAQLRALMEALISPIGGAVHATGDLRFTLPFDLYVAGGDIGMPQGNVTFEVTVNANSSAGSYALGWEFADVKPKYYVRAVREADGVPTSSSGYPYYINTGAGVNVLGFILPMVSATQGIQEIWLYRALKDQGPVEELWHGEYLDILESQAHYNPEAIVNPFFFKPFPTPIDYPKGSYLKIKTGSSSATTDEIVPVQLMPAPQ